MTYFTVSEVAGFLQISKQRVRVLLAQRRIDGFKDSRNIWLIPSPLSVRRGPVNRPSVENSTVRLRLIKGDGNA
ncbi:MAG: DNA-binding protein [Nitrosomonas sp.]|nr:DNA-binding protein [Nitrosomonas sp.]